jgi:AcrR family transcriptional regulator
MSLANSQKPENKVDDPSSGDEELTSNSSVRGRILEATSELVRKRPLSEVTIREIADYVGIRHSLITRLFGTKEELMYEVGLRARAEYAKVVASSPDPIESFHRVFDFLLADPDYTRFVVASVLQPVTERDASGVYPGWLLHAAQLETLVPPSDLAPPPTLGRTTDPDQPVETEHLVDVRLVAVATIVLMGGWVMVEDFVTNAGVTALDNEQLHEAMHGIIDRLLRCELHLDPLPSDSSGNSLDR